MSAMSIQNLKPGTVIGGRYRIEKPLGHGAMGVVYLATHQELGTTLAIKFLDQSIAANAEATERFKREGRASVSIRHPGIVKMTDLDVTPDGVRYLVMEYLQGLTLDALLNRVGTLKPAVAAAVLVPMLDALEAAHAAGVIHRDLKPANVMLSTAPNQAVKLLDFGISKVTKDPKLTSPGAAMGTPDYMAPEQTLDAKSVTAASDLYSLGAIAFELLTGRLPFLSNNVAEMMFKVLKEPPPKLATVVGEIDPRFADLVDALLIKDPNERPQTAAGVRTALLAATKPDTAALWKLVKSPDEVGFAPTFARPSPATPQQLAHLARTLPENDAVPEPELPPGVPRRSARPTAVAPERKTQGTSSAPTEKVQPLAAPRRSVLPWSVMGAVLLLSGGGSLYALTAKERPAPTPPVVVAPAPTPPVVVAPPPPQPEPVRPPEPEPEPKPEPTPTPDPVANTPPAEPAKNPASPSRRVSGPGVSKKSPAQLLVAQGHAALKANDYDLAKKKFTECTRQFDEEADCFAGLAQVLTTLGDTAAADRANKRAANLRR